MKIEVFIPAYNCRDTLPKALASLVSQTDQEFSVCVVDDCGTEPLEDICAMFPQLNLRLIHNPKNLGVGLTRQSAIDTSDADYLIELDADDMLMPMAINVYKQNAILKPDIDFFVAWVFNELPDGNGGKGYITVKDGYTFAGGKMYKTEFLRKYDIRNCEEFSRFADDTYINMLSYELGKTEIIPMPLYLYTCNPNSVTNKNGGKDYWQDVVPKFLRCIEKTSEIICRYKDADEIVHLDGTLMYIKNVVKSRGQKNEIMAYNKLLNNLKAMGRTNGVSDAYLNLEEE